MTRSGLGGDPVADHHDVDGDPPQSRDVVDQAGYQFLGIHVQDTGSVVGLGTDQQRRDARYRDPGGGGYLAL